MKWTYFRLSMVVAAAVTAFVAADDPRKTWNECKCKKTWSPEVAGQPACQDYCCNPDSDPYGEWCLVESSDCEDSDWGYCQPKIQTSMHSTLNCADYANWADKDGDDCKQYAESAWCTMAPGSAVPGVGWHDEWGTIRSFGSGLDNISAFTSCCACGGGNRDSFASSSQYGVSRHTWNGCECKSEWKDPSLGSCSNGCCNLDHDPYGEWCMVASETCEDSDWGYCRPSGINTVYQEDAACQNVADWKDSDGDGCKEYSDNAWCTHQGGYDLGWHDEWGTFDSLKANGKSAKEACCACGGGAHVANAVPTPSIDNGIFARKTWNGCACKASWVEEGIGSCNSYCCNPDDDELGEWCLVQDQSCEDADWGYCQSTLLRTVDAPSSFPGCTNKDFKDSDGDDCAAYSKNAWCTSWGDTGVGWHEEWGDFKTFKDSNGETAITACCACGGGKRDTAVPAPAPSTGPRSTWNNCLCKQSWSESDNPASEPCSTSCCNPDKDPFGEWCVVEDYGCEDSDWGYCKSPGVDGVTPWQYTPGGCTDSLGWKDADGDDCRSYRENNWCSSDGGYSTGWHEEWGTFANFAGGPRQETANQACCACGKGTAGGTSSMGVIAAEVNGRLTRNKCRCIKTWQEEGVGPKCEDYCCNPDGDLDGEWCFVEDSSCEDSDWGYCMPAAAGEGKDVDSDSEDPTCLNKADWKDVEGDDCQTYEISLWCTKASDTGAGWHDEWGSVEDFKSDEVSAMKACCACGGGSVPIKEVAGKTSKFLFISIITSLLLSLVLGISSCYWKRNYNKIKYANIGAETIGRKDVNATPEDI